MYVLTENYRNIITSLVTVGKDGFETIICITDETEKMRSSHKGILNSYWNVRIFHKYKIHFTKFTVVKTYPGPPQ
jgi:hypothetical protein